MKRTILTTFALGALVAFPVFANGKAKHDHSKHGQSKEHDHSSHDKDLIKGIQSYVALGDALADDQLDKAKSHAKQIISTFKTIQCEPKLMKLLKNAMDAATDFGNVKNLKDSRVAFQKLSEPAVTLVIDKPHLQGELQVFRCPMVKGYNRWLQTGDKPKNPYMGTEMQVCGAKVRDRSL